MSGSVENFLFDTNFIIYSAQDKINVADFLHNLTLVTRNTDDFKNISGLKILNPFGN